MRDVSEQNKDEGARVRLMLPWSLGHRHAGLDLGMTVHQCWLAEGKVRLEVIGPDENSILRPREEAAVRALPQRMRIYKVRLNDEERETYTGGSMDEAKRKAEILLLRVAREKVAIWDEVLLHIQAGRDRH